MRITSGPSHETLQNWGSGAWRQHVHNFSVKLLGRKVAIDAGSLEMWTFSLYLLQCFSTCLDYSRHSYLQTSSMKMYILFIRGDFNEAIFQWLLSGVIIIPRMSRRCTCGVPFISKCTPLRPPFLFLSDPFISALTSKWWAATLPDANSPHERESVWGVSIRDWRGLLGEPLLFFSIKPGSLFPSF